MLDATWYRLDRSGTQPFPRSLTVRGSRLRSICPDVVIRAWPDSSAARYALRYELPGPETEPGDTE